MKTAVSILLCAVLLFLAFGKSVLVLDYLVHKKEITRTRCVNKDRPEMQCNGHCYLSKQLKKAEQKENPVPDFRNLKELSPYITAQGLSVWRPGFVPLDRAPVVYVAGRMPASCPGSVFQPPEA